jgi:hypothetical protein
MFSGGVFSLGLAGPLLLLFMGPMAIGLMFSGAAILVRLRADSELTAGESQPRIDSAIAILAISVALSILGAIIYHTLDDGAGMVLVIVGIFLLWPVSAVLAIRGRGVGRSVLLMGHGLIALWLAVILLTVLIHG